MTSKRAYVTMITSDSFVPGVECMLFSLKETKTKIPVCLIVTKQVSKRNIEKLRSKRIAMIVVGRRFFFIQNSHYSHLFIELDKIYVLPSISSCSLIDSHTHSSNYAHSHNTH